MLFSSNLFLFVYLPVVLLIYYLVPRVLRNPILLLFSLLFYGWGEPVYLFLMIGDILLNYICGYWIHRHQLQGRKGTGILVIGVALNLLLLGYFKYANFIFGSLVPAVSLPIGISFYIFQSMSYIIDVYREDAPVQKNPLTFGTYVTLFPQLIAGPIVRYTDVALMLQSRKETISMFASGIRLFIIGLGKKVLLANNFGQLIEIFRASGEKSVLFYWMYGIAFMLHIYFDFSGYSDMAIGLGRIFGFHFIENFNYPYLSKSVAEFWRRWHMSLGSWFRDYVYIPLGGNRVSKGRWLFNTLVVWMLTGLWHGASWNFVLWGLVFAVVLLLEKWVIPLDRLPGLLRHVYVLLIVMFSFVLFNAADMKQAASDFAGLLGFGGVPGVTGSTLYYLRSYGLLFIVGIVGATPCIKGTLNRLEGHKTGAVVLAVLEPVARLVLLILCSAYLVDGSFNPFLYFRF